MSAIIGAEPTHAAVEAVLARSAGNAFYVEELVASGEPAAQLPATLREVLLARVATLSGRLRNYVRAASVAGTRIAPLLMAGARHVRAQVEAALREAVAAHILAESPHDERFEFRHALVQEALYTRSPAR